MNKVNRKALHDFIDRQLDEIERAYCLSGLAIPSLEIPEELEAENENNDFDRLWLALCMLDNLGWELSKLWATVQLNVDTEPNQINEVFDERIQELYQEYLMK